ncbi:unnamed protein product [Ceratitis capitata]|uniref:(Mediterranean fruit fly) hypothetical protein n=1 Tax=Ceratitis capitata TaxID=7213 RepID=A0A811V7E9_CERCA|nr:unnamed protein product [Ceratitis capitata]
MENPAQCADSGSWCIAELWSSVSVTLPHVVQQPNQLNGCVAADGSMRMYYTHMTAVNEGPKLGNGQLSPATCGSQQPAIGSWLHDSYSDLVMR